LVDEIYSEIHRIGASPAIGHKRDDLTGGRSLCFWNVGGYLIIYKTDPEETVILAVLHGRRDIPAVLREREPDE